MESKKEIFSLKEVEKLVKNAYEVGLCDGKEPNHMQEYRNSNHFWYSNKNKWIKSKINYVK